MYCMEHTGAGFETLKPQFALCRAIGVTPLVRVPATEYHLWRAPSMSARSA